MVSVDPLNKGLSFNQDLSIQIVPNSLCSSCHERGSIAGSNMHRDEFLSEKGFNNDISVWEADLEEKDTNDIVENVVSSRLKKRVGRRKVIDLTLAGCPEWVKWNHGTYRKAKKSTKVNPKIIPTLTMEEACSLLEAGAVASIFEDGIYNHNRLPFQETNDM